MKYHFVAKFDSVGHMVVRKFSGVRENTSYAKSFHDICFFLLSMTQCILQMLSQVLYAEGVYIFCLVYHQNIDFKLLYLRFFLQTIHFCPASIV